VAAPEETLMHLIDLCVVVYRKVQDAHMKENPDLVRIRTLGDKDDREAE
jgi:hypothetical protein